MLVALGTTKSMKRLLGTSFITEWVRALQAQPPLLTQIRFLNSSPSARRNCVKVWVSLPLLYLANFSFFGLRVVGLKKYCYIKAILGAPWEKVTSVLHRNYILNTLLYRPETDFFLNSVARTFLSEIADFSQIYRQIRQVFGPKSRKIRQFLPTFNGKIDPSPPKFQFLLHFYALIIFQI